MRARGCISAAAGLWLAATGGALAQGARAEGSAWTAALEGDRATRGAPATVAVRVVARNGFKVNEEYPLHFVPAASETVTFAKTRFDRRDGLALEPCAPGKTDMCIARLPVAFTPTATGTLTIAGTLKFSVCDPERCLIEHVDLAAPIEVGS